MSTQAGTVLAPLQGCAFCKKPFKLEKPIFCATCLAVNYCSFPCLQRHATTHARHCGKNQARPARPGPNLKSNWAGVVRGETRRHSNEEAGGEAFPNLRHKVPPAAPSNVELSTPEAAQSEQKTRTSGLTAELLTAQCEVQNSNQPQLSTSMDLTGAKCRGQTPFVHTTKKENCMKCHFCESPCREDQRKWCDQCPPGIWFCGRLCRLKHDEEHTDSKELWCRTCSKTKPVHEFGYVERREGFEGVRQCKTCQKKRRDAIREGPLSPPPSPESTEGTPGEPRNDDQPGRGSVPRVGAVARANQPRTPQRHMATRKANSDSNVLKSGVDQFQDKVQSWQGGATEWRPEKVQWLPKVMNMMPFGPYVLPPMLPHMHQMVGTRAMGMGATPLFVATNSVPMSGPLYPIVQKPIEFMKNHLYTSGPGPFREHVMMHSAKKAVPATCYSTTEIPNKDTSKHATLVVAGLPHDVTINDLLIFRMSNTTVFEKSKHPGVAFVCYDNPDHAGMAKDIAIGVQIRGCPCWISQYKTKTAAIAETDHHERVMSLETATQTAPTAYALSTLYLRGLDPDVSRDVLLDKLHSIGEVEHIVVNFDQDTQISLGTAEIKFANPADVPRAAAILHSTTVTANFAGQSFLTIRNLPSDVKAESVLQMATDDVDVSCVVHPRGMSILGFSTIQAAERAAERVNGTVYDRRKLRAEVNVLPKTKSNQLCRQLSAESLRRIAAIDAVNLVLARVPKASVGIFGSSVNGTANDASDVDLLCCLSRVTPPRADVRNDAPHLVGLLMNKSEADDAASSEQLLGKCRRTHLQEALLTAIAPTFSAAQWSFSTPQLLKLQHATTGVWVDLFCDTDAPSVDESMAIRRSRLMASEVKKNERLRILHSVLRGAVGMELRYIEGYKSGVASSAMSSYVMFLLVRQYLNRDESKSQEEFSWHAGGQACCRALAKLGGPDGRDQVKLRGMLPEEQPYILKPGLGMRMIRALCSTLADLGPNAYTSILYGSGRDAARRTFVDAVLSKMGNHPVKVSPCTALILGNLRPKVDEDDIKEMLAKEAPTVAIQEDGVRLYTSASSGRSLGYALIEFINEHHAERALILLHGVKIDGQFCRILRKNYGNVFFRRELHGTVVFRMEHKGFKDDFAFEGEFRSDHPVFTHTKVKSKQVFRELDTWYYTTDGGKTNKAKIPHEGSGDPHLPPTYTRKKWVACDGGKEIESMRFTLTSTLEATLMVAQGMWRGTPTNLPTPTPPISEWTNTFFGVVALVSTDGGEWVFNGQYHEKHPVFCNVEEERKLYREDGTWYISGDGINKEPPDGNEIERTCMLLTRHEGGDPHLPPTGNCWIQKKDFVPVENLSLTVAKEFLTQLEEFHDRVTATGLFPHLAEYHLWKKLPSDLAILTHDGTGERFMFNGEWSEGSPVLVCAEKSVMLSRMGNWWGYGPTIAPSEIDRVVPLLIKEVGSKDQRLPTGLGWIRCSDTRREAHSWSLTAEFVAKLKDIHKNVLVQRKQLEMPTPRTEQHWQRDIGERPVLVDDDGEEYVATVPWQSGHPVFVCVRHPITTVYRSVNTWCYAKKNAVLFSITHDDLGDSHLPPIGEGWVAVHGDRKRASTFQLDLSRVFTEKLNDLSATAADANRARSLIDSLPKGSQNIDPATTLPVFPIHFNAEILLMPPTVLKGTALDRNPRSDELWRLGEVLNHVHAFAPLSTVVLVGICSDEPDEQSYDQVNKLLQRAVLRSSVAREQIVVPEQDRCIADASTPVKFVLVRSGDRHNVALSPLPSVLQNPFDAVPTIWFAVHAKLTKQLPVRKWVSASEFEDAAVECGLLGTAELPLVMRANVVNALLAVLQIRGIIVWCDEPGLQEVVVIDPCWVVEATIKVVTSGLSVAYGGANRRRSSHITTDDKFDRLPPTDYTDEERLYLIELLKAHGYLVELDDEEWLVPALLEVCDDENNQCDGHSETVSPSGSHSCYILLSTTDNLAESETPVSKRIIRALTEADVRKGVPPTSVFFRLLAEQFRQGADVDSPSVLSRTRVRYSCGTNTGLVELIVEQRLIKISANTVEYASTLLRRSQRGIEKMLGSSSSIWPLALIRIPTHPNYYFDIDDWARALPRQWVHVGGLCLAQEIKDTSEMQAWTMQREQERLNEATADLVCPKFVSPMSEQQQQLVSDAMAVKRDIAKPRWATDVIISYATQHVANEKWDIRGLVVTTSITSGLSQAGISCYHGKRCEPGCDWQPQWYGRVEDAAVAIVVLSPAYFKSKNCLRELHHLLGSRLCDRIIPILAHDAKGVFDAMEPLVLEQVFKDYDMFPGSELINANFLKGRFKANWFPAPGDGVFIPNSEMLSLLVERVKVWHPM